MPDDVDVGVFASRRKDLVLGTFDLGQIGPPTQDVSLVASVASNMRI